MNDEPFTSHVERDRLRMRDFFIPYFKAKGYEVRDVSEQRGPVDLRIRVAGTLVPVYTIDCKGHNSPMDSFIVELIQAVESRPWSWYWEQKTGYIDAGFATREATTDPVTIHEVDHEKLREFMGKKERWKNGDIRLQVSTTGYGITILAYVLWSSLVEAGVAVAVKPYLLDALTNEF